MITHTQETADYWETYFIRKFDSIQNGYNLKEGGASGKQSQETIDKRSAKLRGRIVSQETRNKLSKSRGNKNYRTGTKHSEETKAKMSKNKKERDSLVLEKPYAGKTWVIIDGKRVWKDKV